MYLFYSRVYAVIEADNEFEKSNKPFEARLFYNQNPVCNGYYIASELNDDLTSGYYEFLLGDDKVIWPVNEVRKLKKNGLLF